MTHRTQILSPQMFPLRSRVTSLPLSERSFLQNIVLSPFFLPGLSIKLHTLTHAKSLLKKTYIWMATHCSTSRRFVLCKGKGDGNCIFMKGKGFEDFQYTRRTQHRSLAAQLLGPGDLPSYRTDLPETAENPGQLVPQWKERASVSNILDGK